jgi:hypothetical protein
MPINGLPLSVQPPLRRFARRLAIGVFLDVWPAWALASLLLAGVTALVCRLFVPSAAPFLSWLWLAPVVATIPALVIVWRRAYRPAEIVALADSLAGGDGLLLTLLERHDPAWESSRLLEPVSRLAVPRLRPWRRLALLAPAIAFLSIALLLPQRSSAASAAMLADDIAADLAATMQALKQEALITPEEEARLEEEIERIRKSAQERVDASAWEAADAVREKMAADLSKKRDAVKWAQESLARYAAAAAQAGGPNASDARTSANAQVAELSAALESLAASGLLANAPADVQQMLEGGRFPADAESLRRLAAALGEFLAERGEKFGDLAALGQEFGRFDPSEFPLEAAATVDGDGDPGNGGLNRGRGDAPLTWGEESLPADRFKSQPLPPGNARRPDDWTPVVVLPGAPQEAPELSASSGARSYAAAAGQAAWRRTLAPRHQSAVKKYFDK